MYNRLIYTVYLYQIVHTFLCDNNNNQIQFDNQSFYFSTFLLVGSIFTFDMFSGALCGVAFTILVVVH